MNYIFPEVSKIISAKTSILTVFPEKNLPFNLVSCSRYVITILQNPARKRAVYLEVCRLIAQLITLDTSLCRAHNSKRVHLQNHKEQNTAGSMVKE